MSSQSPSKATKEDSLSISSSHCSVEKCIRYKAVLGYCELHYTRYKKNQPLDLVVIKKGKFGESLRQLHRPEFNSWRAMKSRCNSKKYWAYNRYGGRGIKICKRWQGIPGFENFLNDMGLKPSPNHTLDRIDNNGDYEPSNCRWSVQKVQVRNSNWVTHIDVGNGDELLVEVLERNSILSRTYYNRVYTLGWDITRAATQKTRVW